MAKIKKITIDNPNDIIENSEDFILLKPHTYAEIDKRNDILYNIIGVLLIFCVIFATGKIYRSIFPNYVIKVGSIAVTHEDYETLVENILIPVQQDIYSANEINFNKETYDYYSVENIDWVSERIKLGLKAEELGYKIDKTAYNSKTDKYGKLAKYFLLADMLEEDINNSYKEPTINQLKDIYELTKENIYINTSDSTVTFNIYQLTDYEEYEAAKKEKKYIEKTYSYSEFLSEHQSTELKFEDLYYETNDTIYIYEYVDNEKQYYEYEDVKKDIKNRYEYACKEGLIDEYVAEMNAKYQTTLY